MKVSLHRVVLSFSAVTALALIAAPSIAQNILVNPGFETGSLSPWFQDRNFGGSVNWNVTSSVAHTGTFSATDNGNLELKQTFAGVPVSQITDVSWWVEHPDSAVNAVAFDLFYSDSTDDEFVLDTTGSSWNFFDLTSELDAGKTLTGISVFGNTAGVTFVDDVSVDVSLPSGTPEPGGIALLAGLGVPALFAARKLRRRS